MVKCINCRKGCPSTLENSPVGIHHSSGDALHVNGCPFCFCESPEPETEAKQ